jgi:type II secretory ATPase GspE/PulE/Tfp pilus assembly ATPase PilB-like protein
MTGDAFRQKPLGQILKEMELISEGQLQEALALQRKEGGVLGMILVRLGYVANEEVLLALAAQLGMEVVDLFELPPEAFEREEVTFDHFPATDPDPIAHSPPVVKLIQLILSTALGAHATEVRFDLRNGRFDVRYRVDGVLVDMESPPCHLAPPMFRRLRHLTGLAGDARDLTAAFAGRRIRVSALWIRTPEEESIALRFSPIPPEPPLRYIP